MSKKIFLIAFIFLSGCGAVSAQAQTTGARQFEYQPLITGFPPLEVPASNDFAGYFNTVMTLVIGLTGILAVLMIVVGGIQYVSTDSWQNKDSGKKRIQAALGGLLLALSSYLILNTIDPSLTNLNFTRGLTPVGDIANTQGDITITVPQAQATPGTATNPSGQQGTGGGTVNGIPYGGVFNKTLQNWQRANPTAAGNIYDGLETVNTLKTYDGVQYVCGNGSTFGGPKDFGVKPTETGAVTKEILRDLDPATYYIAGRWDYSAMNVASTRFEVMNPRTKQKVYGVRPVDWGPRPSTNRSWDVSPGVMSALGATTDQELCVRVN